VLIIYVVNNTVEGGRLTPAFVLPIAAVIREHACKIGVRRTVGDPRPRKRSADVRIGPGVATVGGAKEVVSVVVREASAAFVHTGDLYVACD
jgi:hypothetical protein